jgi:tRNA-splicing ligase RtcB
VTSRLTRPDRGEALAEIGVPLPASIEPAWFDRAVNQFGTLGSGKNGIVHRKGAVRARAGEMVLIPGSIGTASYVGEGLGNPESFSTCQHGAGRAMSRSAARKARSAADVVAEIRSLGIALHSGDPKTIAEEAAFAYKDIETIMAPSATLVRPTKRLTPLGVVKG